MALSSKSPTGGTKVMECTREDRGDEDSTADVCKKWECNTYFRILTVASESRRRAKDSDFDPEESGVFLSKRQNSDTILTFLALIPQTWFWSQIHQRLKGGLRVQSQNSKKKVGAPKMVAGVTTIIWLRVSFSTRVMHLGVEWNSSCEIFCVSVVEYSLPAKIPRERHSHTDQTKSSYPAFLGWHPVAFH